MKHDRHGQIWQKDEERRQGVGGIISSSSNIASQPAAVTDPDTPNEADDQLTLHPNNVSNKLWSSFN